MSVVEALTRACGRNAVAEGNDADFVGGVPARHVVRPTEPAQVAAMMAAAATAGATVVTRGRGTKLNWGNAPSSLDVLLDLSQLDAVVEHAADDLVVTVQAGIPLAVLQEHLGRVGQRLALDEVVAGSTVGGLIATGLAGPSRVLYGGVRDLLIGVTVVRPDGVVARSGGRVVKNVAGFDLCKLYTGSYGTLGAVTEATFRLHPLPQARAFVGSTFDDEREGARKISALRHSSVVPSAIEIRSSQAHASIVTAVLLEGSAPGVEARAQQVAGMLGPESTVGTEPPSWWGQLPGPSTVRCTVPPAGVWRLQGLVKEVSQRLDRDTQVQGSAATGIVYAGFEERDDVDVTVELMTQIRRAATAEGGFSVVLRASPTAKARTDVWGPVPGLSLMRRVKEGFDPHHRMAPGRFVGGM